MHYIKLSVIILILFQTALAQKFNSKQCLQSKFKTKINAGQKFFGLVKNELTLNKSVCNIQIRFNGILETLWDIDLCREPIHMKITSKGTQSVLKKTNNCIDSASDDFCYYYKELTETLSDYGLIYADGVKEKLDDAHGMTYCASLLLKKYLNKGVIFSAFEAPDNIYEMTSSNCDLPKKDAAIIQEVQKPLSSMEKPSTLNLEQKVEENTSNVKKF